MGSSIALPILQRLENIIMLYLFSLREVGNGVCYFYNLKKNRAIGEDRAGKQDRTAQYSEQPTEPANFRKW